MWRILLPVKLQHDAGNFRGIITFTRCWQPLPIKNALVWNVKKVYGQHWTRPRFWCEEYSSKVTTCMIMHAIAAELSLSHGNTTLSLYASLKSTKGHAMVNIQLILSFDWIQTSNSSWVLVEYKGQHPTHPEFWLNTNI